MIAVANLFEICLINLHSWFPTLSFSVFSIIIILPCINCIFPLTFCLSIVKKKQNSFALGAYVVAEL